MVLSLSASAQWPIAQQFFEGPDMNQYPFEPTIDTTHGLSAWQIGTPSKTVFDSAYSLPRAIMTDTMNPVSSLDTARFEFVVDQNYLWSPAIYGFQWMQKLDFPSETYGLVEFTTDGIQWRNVFNDPYVYNWYGWDATNVDTLSGGEIVFTGQDTVWRNLWLCIYYDFSGIFEYRIRFTVWSNAETGPADGWMMDNFYLNETIVHVLKEPQMPEPILVYPTETDGRVNIRIDHNSFQDHISALRLIDLEGRVLQEYADLPPKFWIEFTDQAPGWYIVEVQTKKHHEQYRVHYQPR